MCVYMCVCDILLTSVKLCMCMCVLALTSINYLDRVMCMNRVWIGCISL